MKIIFFSSSCPAGLGTSTSFSCLRSSPCFKIDISLGTQCIDGAGEEIEQNALFGSEFRKVCSKVALLINQKPRYVKASYESVYRTYRVERRMKKDGRVHVRLEIPFGCTALVGLAFYPGEATGELGAGVYEFEYQPTEDLRCRYTICQCKSILTNSGFVIFTGCYDLTIRQIIVKIISIRFLLKVICM